MANLISFAGVVAYRANVITGVQQDPQQASHVPRMVIDRGIVELRMEGNADCSIVLKPIRNEQNWEDKQITLRLDQIELMTTGLVISPNGKLRKGKTTIRMHAPLVANRMKEEFIMKMDVEDHDRLHAKIAEVMQGTFF